MKKRHPVETDVSLMKEEQKKGGGRSLFHIMMFGFKT